MEDARIEGFGNCNDEVESASIRPPRNYEIDTLKVKKVYFSCQMRECIEDQLFDIDYPAGNNSDYRFVRCEFGEAVIEPIKHVPIFTEIDNYYAKLRATVAIPIYIVVRRKRDGEFLRLPAYPIIDGCRQKDNKVRFCIETIVYAPADFLRQGRFFPDVESIGVCEDDCIKATGRDNIELTIGFFLILKVLSEVQLKVPTFGFADIPEPCDEVAPVSDLFCETFLDEDITEFPEQFFPPQRNQIGGIEDRPCPPRPYPPKKKKY